MITVIIPAKNSARTLPACLEGVLCQPGFQYGIDYEVIVVDDGSDDATAEIAARKGLKVISQANAGPASARNAGARAAVGDILVFTDADCAPDPSWLSQLTQPLKNPEVVGAKGIYRTRQTGLVPRFVQLEYESKYRRMEKLATIDFIDTYSAAYRKDVFLENGGFDVRFPVPSVEDQELSFRLSAKGYCMVFAAQAAVYHEHDLTLTEYIQRKFNIGYWKACMLRWLPEKTFEDSHTLPSQRWQIMLLGLAAIGIPLAFFLHWLVWVIIFCMAIFYISAGQFLALILKRDRDIFLPGLILVVARAAALGSGLLIGLIFSPKKPRSEKQVLNMQQRAVKRISDIVLSALGLILFTPFFPIVMLAIKLDSQGPVFYSQERAGEHGKPFRVVKFRTMVANAEQLLDELIHPDTLQEPVYKLRQDPRVTQVGKYLRRWSLDEVPQLWNVLHGEMSMVGPRPEETWLVARYNDAQRQRLVVKPGLTGPMQVSGRGELDFKTRLELDLDYIRNYSLVKDIRILFKSIPVVISGKGAF